jgi:hypothetical protein
MKSIKNALLMAATVIALGSSVALAGAAGNVSRKAGNLEKRVKKDAAANLISQDDATKYIQSLEHIISAMTDQSSTTSLRRGLKEEMARIATALDTAEQGGASPSPTP